MDRVEAGRALSELLGSDHQDKQKYALLLLAKMHLQMSEKDDGWNAPLKTLNDLIRNSGGHLEAQASTVYVACVPHKDKAVSVLEDAGMDEASYVNLFCWFLLEKNRELDISQTTQLKRLGEYYLKIAPGSMNDLNALVAAPAMGLFQGVNWNEPTNQQRDLASASVERLIVALREGTLKTGLTHQQEQNVSGYSRSLCHVIELVSLSLPVNKAAVGALELKLKHLLELRSRPDSEVLAWLADSTSRVAVAITLLTGHVPDLLKTATIGGNQNEGELRILTKMTTDPRSALQENFRSASDS
jgi:hypothetical protein